MIPNEHMQVLRKIVTRLNNRRAWESRRIQWVVTGSVGMALQGMDLNVHDIDLQTDRDGAYEVERSLAEYVVQPVRYVESERIRSHLGRLAIDGIQVEIMGDIQKRLEDGTWEELVRVEEHRQWLAVEGMQVPVMALILSLRLYCFYFIMLLNWEAPSMLVPNNSIMLSRL